MEILKLPFPFVTPRDVALPFRDAFGVPHGDRYVPMRDAADMNIATRVSFGALKFGRAHQALAMNEMRPLYAFSFNPYVIDIRDQYPVYDQKKYNEARMRGRRMSVDDVMTLDIVLTLVLPPDHRLHYHAVSIKDGAGEFDDATKTRLRKEERKIEARGWTYELLRGNQFDALAWGNHAVMKTWVANVDVWRHYDEASAFARRLLVRSLRGTLDDIMNRHARHLGISLDWCYELFAVAVCFGFLYPDHRQALRTDKQLHLLWRT
jgi:TnsA endonuclease N terminal.